jgi:hypothetical protein
MVKIVLVHGIAQEQLSADDLEKEWLPSLTGGVRNAGHAALADQLWPIREPAIRTVRMAFYGSCYLAQDQQGCDGGQFTVQQFAVADAITLEWLTNALESTRPRDAGAAGLELQALRHDPADVQGIGAIAGRIIAALDRIPWITQAGLARLSRVNKALAQVVRYLTEPDIRTFAIAQVHQHLGPDTQVVIGHSLGSVVAYEAIQTHAYRLPTLITLGSPLGLSAINRRLQRPPGFPPNLARWVNLADRDDIVAARPHLARMFDVGRPNNARFDSTYTVDNGAKPHRANFYLTKSVVGHAVAEALRETYEPDLR